MDAPASAEKDGMNPVQAFPETLSPVSTGGHVKRNQPSARTEDPVELAKHACEIPTGKEVDQVPREDEVERGVGEIERVGVTEAEVAAAVRGAGGSATGAAEHGGREIDPGEPPVRVQTKELAERETRAHPHFEDRFAALHAGDVEGAAAGARGDEGGQEIVPRCDPRIQTRHLRLGEERGSTGRGRCEGNGHGFRGLRRQRIGKENIAFGGGFVSLS